MKRGQGASSILLQLGVGALCLHLGAFLALARPVQAEDTGSTPLSGDAELAQELSNPIADLVTIPPGAMLEFTLRAPATLPVGGGA